MKRVLLPLLQLVLILLSSNPTYVKVQQNKLRFLLLSPSRVSLKVLPNLTLLTKMNQIFVIGKSLVNLNNSIQLSLAFLPLLSNMVTSLPSNHRRMLKNYLPLLRKSTLKERTLTKKEFLKLKKLKKKLLRTSPISLVLKSLLLHLSGVVLLHKKSSNTQVNSLLLDNGCTTNVSKLSQKVKSTELS